MLALILAAGILGAPADDDAFAAVCRTPTCGNTKILPGELVKELKDDPSPITQGWPLTKPKDYQRGYCAGEMAATRDSIRRTQRIADAVDQLVKDPIVNGLLRSAILGEQLEYIPCDSDGKPNLDTEYDR